MPKKKDFSVSGLDVLGLGKPEELSEDEREELPGEETERQIDTHDGVEDSEERSTVPLTTDAEIEDRPVGENPIPKESGSGLLNIAPPAKKETMTIPRLARLTKTLDKKVQDKIKKSGLSYNYVVNKLLELWVDSGK